MTFQSQMAADLSVFFADYGVSATYTHAAVPATISVIFDNEYVPMNLGGVEVESLGPAATCKSSDVSAAAHGDTLTVDSVTYYIKGIHPDGTGITLLILSKDG